MLFTKAYKKIKMKIYISFFSLIIACFIIFMSYSFYRFTQIRFQPGYHENAITLSTSKTANLYHSQYGIIFVLNNTLLYFLKNLFFISLLFYTFCYSFLIKKEETITDSGTNLEFAYIAIHGVYILIFLTLLNYFAMDMIIPAINAKLDKLEKKTSQSLTLLKNANYYYFNNEYDKAKKYYVKYLYLSKNDKIVKTRLREINNILNAIRFKRNKENKNNKKLLEVKKPLTLKDKTDYEVLADIFYEEKDYHTAWYYYQYVINTDPNKTYARDRIEEIKKIIKYQNSLKKAGQKLTENELLSLLNSQEQENKRIYMLRTQANNYIRNEKYHQAYFVYNEILKINPKLRDIERDKNEMVEKLKNIAVELEEITETNIYGSRKNMTFFINENQIVIIDEVKNIGLLYYLTGITIYSLDENYNITAITRAPFGKNLTKTLITLYCYSLSNITSEFYPLTKYLDSKGNVYRQELVTKKFTIETPIPIGQIYNFNYDYKKTIEFSLHRLFNIYDVARKIENKNNFNLGLNNIYIKTAILDKISRIFLFFILNLLTIPVAWRLHENYYKKIPIMDLILMGGVPVFLYMFIKLVLTLSTTYFSIVAEFSTTSSVETELSNFMMSITITFVINLAITVLSILKFIRTKT